MCSRWKFGWNKFIFGWKPLHCDTLTTSTVGCFQWFARGNCVHNIGYICLSLEYKLLFLIQTCSPKHFPDLHSPLAAHQLLIFISPSLFYTGTQIEGKY